METALHVTGCDTKAVGRITLTDSGEELLYDDKDAYLTALSEFLDYRPGSIKYKTLVDDPGTRKGVDDLIYGFYGEKTHTLLSITENRYDLMPFAVILVFRFTCPCGL